MAVIDIIRKMDDAELLHYYTYCMKERFYEIRYKNNFAGDSIYLGSQCCYKLHWNNEEFLLSEMWNRFITSNFVKQCWWKSKNPWQTKISYPNVRQESVVNVKPIKNIKDVIFYKDKMYTFIASGTKRKVYLSPDKNHVIKIAKEPFSLGIQENKTEADMYANNPDSIYAKCELIENNWLKMEYVEPGFFTKDDNLPEWTLTIAEHQIGYTLDGRLVAYDYGSEK